MSLLPPTPSQSRVPLRPRSGRHVHGDLGSLIRAYADGEDSAGRRLRRLLAPPLLRLAEAGLGRRSGRQRVTQTAITVALADLETGRVPVDPLRVAFRGVAHVVEATGHDLGHIEDLEPWMAAFIRVVEVELADPERLARAFGVSTESVVTLRAVVADALDLTTPRVSECPGWGDVRTALRVDDVGAWAHRRTCGRCTLVAEHVVARRHRLWPDPPSGPFGPVFDAPL